MEVVSRVLQKIRFPLSLYFGVVVISRDLDIHAKAYFELSSSDELWERNRFSKAQSILLCLEPLVLSRSISSTFKVMNNFVPVIHPGSHLVIDFQNDDSDHIAIYCIVIADFE